MALTVKTCVVSVPSLFTPSKASYTTPHLSIPYRPFTVKLSCSTSLSLFSVKDKEPLLRICTVSAQQEDNPVLVEELNESEEKVFQGKFNWGGENESGGDGYADPPEEAKVYVGNLPYDVDSEQLAKLFEEAGVVEISEVIYNRETDQSRGFGFVTMSTMEEAEKAVEMFNRYEVNGRLLTVNKAAPKGSRAERPPRVFDSTPSPRIYVGNLPWTADDARLEEVFSEYGKVVSARVISDRETGRSRGFGFVVMSSESEVNDAISNLDGQSLDGRVIRVNVAEEKPRRSRF